MMEQRYYPCPKKSRTSACCNSCTHNYCSSNIFQPKIFSKTRNKFVNFFTIDIKRLSIWCSVHFTQTTALVIIQSTNWWVVFVNKKKKKKIKLDMEWLKVKSSLLSPWKLNTVTPNNPKNEIIMGIKKIYLLHVFITKSTDARNKASRVFSASK